MYRTNCSVHAIEVNSLVMLSFLPMFVHKVTQKKQKITNIHKALHCIFMIYKYSKFIQYRNISITIDTQYEFCVLKGVYYTRIRMLANVD